MMNNINDINEDSIIGLQDVIKFENDMRRVHMPNEHLMELVHKKAFNNKGLGNSLLDIEDQNVTINKDRITSFIKKHLRLENAVVCVVGHDHEQVFDLVKNETNKFLNMANNSASFSSNLRAMLTQQTSSKSDYNNTIEIKDTYVGGINFVGENYKLLQTNSQDMPTSYHTYCYVGLQGASLNSKHYYELALIQTLMGGGSSFSAGGPGKGMHSLLYQNILNRYGFVESCQFELNCYLNNLNNSSGLVGISGSTYNKNKIYDVIYILLDNLTKLTKPDFVNDISLNRAKNQLKHNYLMNLEYQQHLIEDMITQAIVYNGHILDPVHICSENVDTIAQGDICSTMRDIINRKKFTLVIMDTNQQNSTTLQQEIDLNLIRKIFSMFGLQLTEQ